MALEKSEAILLKAFNWSESSRTVVFFTERHGKLALIDKGGRQLSSKRGRLLQFARMELTFYTGRRESTGYIKDAAVIQLFDLGGDGGLGRLAYGSAACELLYSLLPEHDAHPDTYRYFCTYIGCLSSAAKDGLPQLFIAFFLRVLTQLGYHPSLGNCVECSRQPAGSMTDDFALSPDRGALICSSCQTPGGYYIPLSGDGLVAMQSLQGASLKEAPAVPIRYSETTLVLECLGRFVSYLSGISGKLKSLEFLEKLKNSQLNG
ncbi:MAG: DNA repair protein RecO [Candidatus Zixiibacteriota bacterium]